jgi:hypothetical protein
MRSSKPIHRINPETGFIERWVKPPGRPGIWIQTGFCARCSPYEECLKLATLEEDQWEEVSGLLHGVHQPAQVRAILDGLGLYGDSSCSDS